MTTTTRSAYDLGALVALAVTDFHLPPPLVARRDSLGAAFGVDIVALSRGPDSVQLLLAGRDLEAERARFRALPTLAKEPPQVAQELLRRLERDGVVPSVVTLLEVTRDCVRAAMGSGPFGTIVRSGFHPLGRHLVESAHREQVRQTRAALLAACRSSYRACVEILYPDMLGTVELGEEAYDEADWL